MAKTKATTSKKTSEKFEQPEQQLDSKVKNLAFQTLQTDGTFLTPSEDTDLDVEDMIEMYQSDGKIAQIINMPVKAALEEIVDYTHPDPKIVEFVNKYFMSSQKYKDWLYYILTSRWIGVSVNAVQLKQQDGMVTIEDIYTIDPTTYYSTNGIGLKNITCNTASGEIVLQRKNCIVHTNDALWGNPYGTSLMKYIRKFYLDKLEIKKAWKTFLRRFGVPIMVGRLPADCTRTEYDNMLEGLVGMAYGAVHILQGGLDPKTGKKNDALEIVESHKGAGDFKDLLKELDKDIIISLGGSSILFNTDENGSYSLGAIHLKIFRMTVDTIRNQLQDIFCGKILPAIINANFGEQETYGQLVFRRMEGRDFKEAAQGFVDLVQSGVLMPQEPQIRKALGLATPTGTYNYNNADVAQGQGKEVGTDVQSKTDSEGNTTGKSGDVQGQQGKESDVQSGGASEDSDSK